MVDAPAGLIVERRKKRIVHGIADLNDGPTNKFAETLLVAEFLAQRGAGNKDNLLAQHGDLEDLA